MSETHTAPEVATAPTTKKKPAVKTKGEKAAEALRKLQAGREKKAAATTTKKAAKAPAKKSAKKKTDVAAGAAQVLTSKDNAEKTAQPGIISDIMQLLRDAKNQNVMYSVEDMGKLMESKHPERKLSGMLVTIRAQVSRLPRERNFNISKARDGHIVRYAAA